MKSYKPTPRRWLKQSARMLLLTWLGLMLVAALLSAGCSTAPRVSVSPAVVAPRPVLEPPPEELMRPPPAPGWFHARVQMIFQTLPSGPKVSAGK